MTTDPKRIAALILARMATCDGRIDALEREMLAELTGETPHSPAMETLFQESRTADLHQLCAGLTRYADRFFVVLRAYMMAHIDARFDVAEEAFYHQLRTALDITPEDRQLIRDSHASLYIGNEQPHPRIFELYTQSSFYIP